MYHACLSPSKSQSNKLSPICIGIRVVTAFLWSLVVPVSACCVIGLSDAVVVVFHYDFSQGNSLALSSRLLGSCIN